MHDWTLLDMRVDGLVGWRSYVFSMNALQSG